MALPGCPRLESDDSVQTQLSLGLQEDLAEMQLRHPTHGTAAELPARVLKPLASDESVLPVRLQDLAVSEKQLPASNTTCC